MKLLLHIVHLLFLQGLANQFHFFRVYIVFDRKVDLFLLAKLNDLLVPTMVVVELFSDVTTHFVNFSELFLFELFDQIECSFFIVGHVLVPGISKFVVLESLGVFNVHKFSLLSDSHVVMLSLLLITAPPVENSFELIGHHVVALGLIALSHLVHDFQESYDPLIGQKINA